MPYIIIVIGLCITTFGFRMLFQKKDNTSMPLEQAQTEKSSNDLPISTPVVDEDTVGKILITEEVGKTDTNAITNTISEDKDELNKQKGNEFESFVVNHFEPKYFDLHEWRGDKYSNGRYASSNHYPDLEINFNFKSKNIQSKFAIECKYRSYFFNNGIKWAEDYQLENYKKYSAELGIPVFIVIGVGGEATAPAEVFIIPLSDINSTFVKKTFLNKYERNQPSENFYWDYENQMLK